MGDDFYSVFSLIKYNLYQFTIQFYGFLFDELKNSTDCAYILNYLSIQLNNFMFNQKNHLFFKEVLKFNGQNLFY